MPRRARSLLLAIAVASASQVTTPTARASDADARSSAASGSATSTSAASASAASPPSDRVRPATATAVAVVPGFLVHGAGHWAAKKPAAARTLLYTGLVGGLAMGAGFTTLYFSGASRKVVAPSAAVVILGAGLFLGSWFADIYGSAGGGDAELGEPRRVLPALEASVGYRFVHDPTFAYRSFFVNAFDLRVGPVRVSPEGWFGVGHVNERLRLAAAYRVAGAMPMSIDGRTTPVRARDGSFIDVQVAGVRHAFAPERFTMTSVELGASGRYDFARIAPSLRGSFFDASLGYALMRHSYATPGTPADGDEQLLARWAYGLWFGRPTATWGEVSAFYEHRHDRFAGGFKAPGLFSGVPGSVGARGFAWLTPELGALVEAQAGSAIVFGASLLVRQPVLP